MPISTLIPGSYGSSTGYPPCPLCAGLVSIGSSCGNCHAPADVIESIMSRDVAGRFIGVLGPSGVGKTVYLGMLLDLLSKGWKDLRGLPRGPFSMSLQRNVMLSLERQRFPEKTPTEPDRWQWVHCEVATGKKGRSFDVITPDVAGEAVMGELESPGSNPTIRALIGRCSGLVVLADIVQVIADGQGQELFATQLISYLASLRPSRRNRKVTVPTAIVFTKTDLCDEPTTDPDTFARDNTPGLWRYCEARLERFRFFRSRVAGSTAILVDRSGRESLIPLRVEPDGVVEPFAWLTTQMK